MHQRTFYFRQIDTVFSRDYSLILEDWNNSDERPPASMLAEAMELDRWMKEAQVHLGVPARNLRVTIIVHTEGESHVLQNL